MDKWEYAELTVSTVMGISVYVYLYENGKIKTLKGFKEVLQALTLLGEDGWELVTVVNPGTTGNQVLYLKRKLGGIGAKA